VVTLQESRPRARKRTRLLILFLFAVALAAVAIVALVADRGGVPRPVEAPPGLGDFWSGRAALVLDKKWTSSSLGVPGGGAASGAHVEVVGDTWYLFNRRTYERGCAGHGPEARQLGTQVRASSDRGAHWSAPVTILAPTPGSAWACTATDGDAVYDPSTTTWRYVFQCQGADPSWSGCYAERRDPSPLGPFSAPSPDPNPVIRSGDLWSRICDDGDECGVGGSQRIGDEGTFNLFDNDGEGWWVGFHGYDGTHAYRGIARTPTFRRGSWQVDGAGGTPLDAVVDARDAASWRESWRPGGPVGAGAGSILREGAWYYQLVEVPDVSLGCKPDQSWDLGLFRTQQLSSTAWAQFPGGNPVVYSARDGSGQAPACNVIYPGLFKDPVTGVTYLMYGRGSTDPADDGIYVYRLERNRNLLDNGSFWRADAAGWRALEGTSTQLSAERTPDGSPDGTPYLAFNCGAPACEAGQSFYQDVPTDPALDGETVAFGGSFRADTGTGDLTVSFLQLDVAGAVVDSTSVPVTVGGEYAHVRGTAEIDGRTRRVRFQVYPRSPGNLRADNLYAIPQDGCSHPRYPAC
jgi:hypothetical protein